MDRRAELVAKKSVAYKGRTAARECHRHPEYALEQGMYIYMCMLREPREAECLFVESMGEGQ